MRPLPKERRYVGLARRLNAGALLRLGPEPLEFSWSCPANNESAVGLGNAGGMGEISWPDGIAPEGMPGPFFGGFAFDSQRLWPGFEAERWVLPHVLAWWNGREVMAAAFGPAGATVETLEARLAAVTELDAAEADELLAGEVVADTGDHRVAWARSVDAALSTPLAKVVLARTVGVTAGSPYSLRAVLKALEARNPTAQTFMFRGTDGSAFVGSTPELLLKSGADGAFETVALAGTAPLDAANDLLTSEKDQREHRLVIEGIHSAILPYVSVMKTGETVLKRTRDVAHLSTAIHGVLKRGADPLEVALALHPTPAVCGEPRTAALEWLRENEAFARGWYAGAVGWRRADAVHLVVAIRSALLSGAHATVFTGAGIVRGSTPEAEWQETARKARTMLTALGVAHA